MPAGLAPTSYSIGFPPREDSHHSKWPAAAKELVLAEWKKTLFLRYEGLEARGWLIEVMKCVEAIGKKEFDLDDVYAFAVKWSLSKQPARKTENPSTASSPARPRISRFRLTRVLSFAILNQERPDGLVFQPLRMRSLRRRMDRRVVVHM